MQQEVPLRPHHVAAALSDHDPVGKGLVVDLDVERPVSAPQSVLLNEVQVFHASNLYAEGKVIPFQPADPFVDHRWCLKTTHSFQVWSSLADRQRRSTRLRRRGASTSIVQRLSVTCVDPSWLRFSLMISLSTNTGINGHLGNLLTYA